MSGILLYVWQLPPLVSDNTVLHFVSGYCPCGGVQLFQIICLDQSARLENERITQTSFVMYVAISQLKYKEEQLQPNEENIQTIVWLPPR